MLSQALHCDLPQFLFENQEDVAETASTNLPGTSEFMSVELD